MSLKIEEAALTSEYVPSEKISEQIALPDEQRTRFRLVTVAISAYMGSTVVYGRRQAIIGRRRACILR
ncbi:MAG: hypothetical protein V8Q43_03340 [Christensenellaceae bacterium]